MRDAVSVEPVGGQHTIQYKTGRLLKYIIKPAAEPLGSNGG
jgi:hypothetical protein